jgi:diacylglycerol kinase
LAEKPFSLAQHGLATLKNLLRSIRIGIAGLIHTAREEANMRWHLLAAVITVACGAAFRISAIEWAIVVGCIGVMLALECVNTAIERLADRVTMEHDPLIGQCKDAAGGAVLVMSGASAIIGLIIFGSRLISLVSE